MKIPIHLKNAPRCAFEHLRIYVFTDPQNQTHAQKIARKIHQKRLHAAQEKQPIPTIGKLQFQNADYYWCDFQALIQDQTFTQRLRKPKFQSNIPNRIPQKYQRKSVAFHQQIYVFTNEQTTLETIAQNVRTLPYDVGKYTYHSQTFYWCRYGFLNETIFTQKTKTQD